MKILRGGLFAILVLFNISMSFPAFSGIEENLIPMPRDIRWGRARLPFEGTASVFGGTENPTALNAVAETLKRNNIKITENSSEANIQIYLGTKAVKDILPDTAFTSDKFPKESYVLEVVKKENKIIIALTGADLAGTFYAAQTLDQLVPEKSSYIRAVKIWDYPAYTKERGYGEYFYGNPWTPEERLEALQFMGTTKMNFYMYSPKDDPYNRDRWREDYPESFINHIKEIIKIANENFLVFSFAMNPGLSMKYSSEEDFEILMKKYEVFRKMGVKNFSLQLDDLGNAQTHPEDMKLFKNWGEAHSFMFNKVYKRLKSLDPAIEYSVCGTMYYIAKPDDYVKSMGECADQGFPIMWTGGDVVDNDITIDEIYQYASGIRRKPFISDNYPVNDFETNRLFMGPLTGRSPELIDHSYPGFIQNPMNQEEASKIALATIADYAWNPFDYEPERSWNAAIKLVAGTKGFETMRLFCELNRSSVMEKREAIELKALIEKYFSSHDEASYNNLKKYAERMASIVEDLDRDIDNKRLVKEIKPWAYVISLYGNALLDALKIAASEKYENGASVSPENIISIQERRALYNKLANKSMPEIYSIKDRKVCGMIPELFIQRITKTGEGFNSVLLKPSSSRENEFAPELDSLSTYTLDMALDGIDTTYFIGKESIEKGQWVQFEMPAPQKIIKIEALMGKDESSDAYFHDGALQYTEDFKTWKTLTKANSLKVVWESEAGVTMRAIRLIAEKSQSAWLVIREFKAVPENKPVFILHKGDDDIPLSTAINDFSVITTCEIPAGLKKDDCIIAKFPDGASSVKTISVLQDEKNFIDNAELEISEDGTNWKSAGAIMKSAEEYKIKAQPITAIRLRLKENLRNKAIINEITIQ